MSRHLVIYTDDPDRGGVAQYNHCLALGLIAAGYRVSIVQTASEGWRVREQRAVGIGHRWIGYDTGREFQRTLVETADAERAFLELKPDLVIFSDCCPVSNIAARHVAVKSGIPFVVVVNFVAAYLAERFKKCLPVLAGQYAKAREVIAVSTENKELLHRLFGLPESKGSVIFYGVPDVFFSPQTERQDRGPDRLYTRCPAFRPRRTPSPKPRGPPFARVAARSPAQIENPVQRRCFQEAG